MEKGIPKNVYDRSMSSDLTSPVITGNTTIGDGATIGLGAGKALIQFDDEVIDVISLLNCALGIGTSSVSAGNIIQVNGRAKISGITIDAYSVFNTWIAGSNAIGQLDIFGDANATDPVTINDAGNCSALSFTDRTPFYEGDAIAEIANIKGKDGGIDHASLPLFARKETIRNIYEPSTAGGG
jgi:hypothetical protein